MDRVGGFASFALLREDARAYEDVVLMMQGENQAQRMLALERRSREGAR